MLNEIEHTLTKLAFFFLGAMLAGILSSQRRESKPTYLISIYPLPDQFPECLMIGIVILKYHFNFICSYVRNISNKDKGVYMLKPSSFDG